MIKYYFREDMVKTGELLTMITKSVSGCMIEEMPLYQRTKKKLLDAQNSILEFEKIIAEKDVAIAEQSNIISKKDKEIALLKEEMLSLKG